MNFRLWCDFIENDFIKTDFVSMLQDKIITGATSNPSIFKNAILASPAYKNQIKKNKNLNAKKLYEILAINDIRAAANKLAPQYSKGLDGFVSLEIDPRLYDNTNGSIFEAKRLFAEISRENVMMKIPATKQSFEVMSELISSGINVNATLIFSQEQVKNCVEALNEGYKKFLQKNLQKNPPKSVISVFVSRFDRTLNNRLTHKNLFGISNAKIAYKYIQNCANPNITTLFASTGVKGDDLPKDYYINALSFENSINTAPLDAIKAYAKGLKKQLKFDENKAFDELLDDDYNKVCKNLLDDGLKQFCIAFEDILSALK